MSSVLELIDEKEKRECEKDFLYFCMCAWRVLEPNRKFDLNWHYAYICKELMAIVYNVVNNVPKTQDIIFNTPPRTLKTFIVSICFPVWAWIQNPGLRFLTSSYSHSLSKEHTWQSRLLILSNWFQCNWGNRFSMMGDQNVKEFYANDKRGYRIATSTLGTATGRGGDILIADDPISSVDALSENARDACYDWWISTWSSRLNDQRYGVRWLTMQRLHTDDLTGRLLSLHNDEYRHICFTASRYIDNVTKPKELRKYYDILGGKDKVFFPDRFPKEVLDKIRKSQGTFTYNAQYDQNPESEEGGLFKRSFWKYWYRHDSMPMPDVHLPSGGICQSIRGPKVFGRIVIGVDATFKGKEDSDRVAIIVLSEDKGNVYLVDEICKVMGFLDTIYALSSIVCKYPTYEALAIEPAANGPAIMEVLKSKVPRIVEAPTNGMSKIQRALDSSRAMSLLATVEAGNVYLPHSGMPGYAWVDDYVKEFSSFPRGEHDDRVDATVHAYRRLSISLPGAFTL